MSVSRRKDVAVKFATVAGIKLGWIYVVDTDALQSAGMNVMSVDGLTRFPDEQEVQVRATNKLACWLIDHA
ncbi:hypothetical protein [Xanthomonas fragariae]|uniref:hypothetical protein n=1 Tax=Xanthomonas fragariae TaxID=48664 RepID=UPI003D189D6C